MLGIHFKGTDITLLLSSFIIIIIGGNRRSAVVQWYFTDVSTSTYMDIIKDFW